MMFLRFTCGTFRHSSLGGLQLCRYKGHSKWQNIRHTKGSKDTAKGMLANIHCTRIRLAIAQNGHEIDPKKNAALSKAIKNAISEGVFKTTVDNLLKNYGKVVNKEMEFIVRAPGNSRLAILTHISSKATFLNYFSTMLKKHGASIEPPSTLKSFFEKKGIVLVKGPPSLEAAEEMAIEVEAEEVYQVSEDTYEFVSDPLTFPQVRDKLFKEFTSYDYLQAEITYIPLQTVTISPTELELVNKIKERFLEKPDVSSVHDNIIEDEAI